MKLLVRNLNKKTEQELVQSRFETYGTVQYCTLVMDSVTGLSKGFGFVEMPNAGEAKAAMKWWLSMRDLAPPESVQSTWTEVATTFAAGRAAQGLVYGENAAWIATDETKSRVVGEVGVALPPLEPAPTPERVNL